MNEEEKFINEENIRPNPLDKLGSSSLADKEKQVLFESLANTDLLLDFLRDIMEDDMKRYFSATDATKQMLVKGMFNRTMNLYNKIKDSKTKASIKKHGTQITKERNKGVA